MKNYKVGVIGATGMVGQRFITLLADHPWFDLTVLAINEPVRAARIIEGTSGRGNFEYLGSVLMPMLVKASMTNNLHPKDDPEKILKYISATYAGIETNCILSACYRNELVNVKCNPKEMFELLAKTIIFLFGGNV